MELPGSPSEGVAALFIPPDLSNQDNTILTVFTSCNTVFGTPSIVSTIINVSLVDGAGNSIDQLESPLTICFSRLNISRSGEVCLGYFDERRTKWICQDKCLQRSTSKAGVELLCGDTDRLANFALLLSGSKTSKASECQSGGTDLTLPWASFGFVLAALLL